MNIEDIEDSLWLPRIAYSNQSLVEPLQSILVRLIRTRFDCLSIDEHIPEDLLQELIHKAEIVRSISLQNHRAFLVGREHANLACADASFSAYWFDGSPTYPHLTYVTPLFTHFLMLITSQITDSTLHVQNFDSQRASASPAPIVVLSRQLPQSRLLTCVSYLYFEQRQRNAASAASTTHLLAAL